MRSGEVGGATTMHAMTIGAFGGLDVLNRQEMPIPKARPGYVLVKVEAVGVNYYDTLIRSGAVSRDIALPHVGGSDVVGVIEATGEDVTGFAPGQKVIVAPGYPTDVAEQTHRPENEARSYFPTGTFEWGGYAQFMEVSARWVLPDDTGLPPEELAAIPLVLVTAVHAVRSVGKVGPGQRVLVQAGASGAGSMAIQIAKVLGAKVIATVSTEAKAKLARELGADAVVNYRAGSVADELLAFTSGEGVDVVIDPVGGITLSDNISSLRPRGTIVNLGLSGGVAATIPNLYQFFRNELRIVGSWMGSMDELRFGLGLVCQGKVRAALDQVLPLAAAREAHRLIAERRVTGKLVLLPWAA
jgi:NADPH:quinone reductase-like Zn-dependent oxidoreductase